MNHAAEELRAWLGTYQIKMLNVTGNRGSSLSAGQLAQYRQMLSEALR